MLQHVPQWLGHALRGVRAGADKLVIANPALGTRFDTIDLSSPAFANGARLPERFTADGAGVSPPLLWRDPPAGTVALALIVEDADAPARQPLVHAIVRSLPAEARMLSEGAIVADGRGGPDGRDVGRNSFLGEGWLPPDPPTGHGDHSYAFQLFALSIALPLAPSPGRGALVEAMAGHVLAAGLLVGTYSRGEPAEIGPVGATPLPA